MENKSYEQELRRKTVEREKYLGSHLNIWSEICQRLEIVNLGRTRKEDFEKYPEGFSAEDTKSCSRVISCPGRLIYYSFFEFGSPIQAHKLYDTFSQVCANQSDLEAIPRGSQEVFRFNFESFLCNLVNVETGKVHKFEEGNQLEKHLATLLRLARS